MVIYGDFFMESNKSLYEIIVDSIKSPLTIYDLNGILMKYLYIYPTWGAVGVAGYDHVIFTPNFVGIRSPITIV